MAATKEITAPAINPEARILKRRSHSSLFAFGGGRRRMAASLRRPANVNASTPVTARIAATMKKVIDQPIGGVPSLV
jgi:hypothetical protein